MRLRSVLARPEPAFDVAGRCLEEHAATNLVEPPHRQSVHLVSSLQLAVRRLDARAQPIALTPFRVLLLALTLIAKPHPLADCQHVQLPFWALDRTALPQRTWLTTARREDRMSCSAFAGRAFSDGVTNRRMSGGAALDMALVVEEEVHAVERIGVSGDTPLPTEKNAEKGARGVDRFQGCFDSTSHPPTNTRSTLHHDRCADLRTFNESKTPQTAQKRLLGHFTSRKNRLL